VAKARSKKRSKPTLAEERYPSWLDWHNPLDFVASGKVEYARNGLCTYTDARLARRH